MNAPVVADRYPRWGPEQDASLRAELRGDDPPIFDLVVVGAGISGAGVARDAAMRGLKTLVIEAKDVAYGTSSRSTRLIHGGVRYLEQGQVGLVYEALRERARLYSMAPHLVAPSRFLFPAYRGDRLPPWKLRAGLALYDLLSLYRGKGHRYLNPSKCLEREPLLEAQDLRGAVEYEDAVTDDATLTLSVLADARRRGAEVLTHTAVESIARDAEGLHAVALAGGVSVRSRATMIAAGPWTGPRLLGAPGAKLLSLSKGVHVVVRSEDAPVRNPVVVQVRGQRRILFVVPWGPRTYLGTTDTHYEGDPGTSGIEPVEIEEILELCARVLPGARLSPDRVVGAWSGVRPLVRPEGAQLDTVELARTHRIVENEVGVLALVGGKLTTYRAMAEEAVDRVVRSLPAEIRSAARTCQTHIEPVVAGATLTDAELDGSADDGLIRDLAPRHGPRARELAAVVQSDASLSLEERLVADLPYRRVEIEHAITHGGARHLDDILRRRVPLALTDARAGGGCARWAAQRLAHHWGFDQAAIDQELERYAESVATEAGRAVELGPDDV